MKNTTHKKSNPQGETRPMDSTEIANAIAKYCNKRRYKVFEIYIEQIDSEQVLVKTRIGKKGYTPR